ncbi:MAG: sigma 54-interacting transcriptional regulator [Deltaproteobacteria bacterium]|nr:sigma 54-interacting transcriptional regulator [Deltaproteobacteria bacterium]
MAEETLDDSTRGSAGTVGPPSPGLVVVFSAGRPALGALVVPPAGIVIGREPGVGHTLDDQRLSRRHAEIRRRGGVFVARDLGSRNGSFADGVGLGAEWSPGLRVLRLGDSVLVPAADVRPFKDGVVSVVDGVVRGPRLAALYQDIASAATSATTLHIRGETGSGKELAARQFHRVGPRPEGPFVAVNCAGIPAALAERLLFGARRGAYSGAAADTEGYLQTADGGTLFLDEVAELGAEVQAKLLRVLETREVLPLGAQRPLRVDVRVCSATHRDLRAEVAAGRFREDLYFRLGRPALTLPPLRERPEEVPWIIAEALAAVRPALSVRASFVEAVLLRPWPGNVRELLTEVAEAARRATAARSRRLEAVHLPPEVGQPMAPAAGAAPEPAITRAGIEAALARAHGNVSQAARELGMHRTQLRRYVTSFAIDPRRFGSG